MNTKDQYTMMKNPETQRLPPKFKFTTAKHEATLFHQPNPTQNNCIKTPIFATLIWASHTHYANQYTKLPSCDLLDFCNKSVS